MKVPCKKNLNGQIVVQTVKRELSVIPDLAIYYHRYALPYYIPI